MDALNGMRVAVTGGTGFVGRHLLPLLLAQGARVTCIVRAGSPPPALPPGVAVRPADLASGLGLEAALAGQDALIHMAALLFGSGWQDYLAANGQGADSLARALGRLAKKPHVTVVSSLAATGPSAQAPGARPDAGLTPVSAYGWSKLLAEKTMCAVVPAGVLRPPIIYGSGDRGLLPIFRAAARGLGISPGLGRDYPVSLVHADDAARAIALICARKARGVFQVSDGQTHTLAGFCRAAGKVLGRRRVRVINVPLPVLALAALGGSLWGCLADRAARSLGRRPPKGPGLNLDKYREARAAGWLGDDSRIRQELGFEPRMDLEAGLEETVAGYRREGWL